MHFEEKQIALESYQEKKNQRVKTYNQKNPAGCYEKHC